MTGKHYMVDKAKRLLYNHLDSIMPSLKSVSPNEIVEYQVNDHIFLTTEPFGKSRYLKIDKSIYTCDVVNYYFRTYGPPSNTYECIKAFFATCLLDIIKPVAQLLFKLPREGEIFTTLYNKNEDVIFGLSINPLYQTAKFLYKAKPSEEYFFTDEHTHRLRSSQTELISYVEQLCL